MSRDVSTELHDVRQSSSHDRRINAAISASSEQRRTMEQLLQAVDWLDDPMRVNLLLDCCLTMTLHEWWQSVSEKRCGVADPVKIAQKLHSVGILDLKSFQVLQKHYQKPLDQRNSANLRLVTQRLIASVFDA